MKKYFLLPVLLTVVLFFNSYCQNVGIGTNTPLEKLHVDSGHIKIGKAILSTGQTNLIKFGDGDFVTLGEALSDDQMVLTASHFLLRANGGTGRVGINTTAFPAAQLEVNGNVRITDGNEGPGKVFTSDGLGMGTWLAPASGSGAFKAVVSTTQNFSSGTITNIIYTTEDYDDATAFFTTQYVVPVTGLYHFDAMVNWNITSVPFLTTYLMVLTVNGSDVHENDMKVPANIGGTHSQSINCDLKLTAGQTVSIYLNHNSGILQPVIGIVGPERYSFFSGRRVN